MLGANDCERSLGPVAHKSTRFEACKSKILRKGCQLRTSCLDSLPAILHDAMPFEIRHPKLQRDPPGHIGLGALLLLEGRPKLIDGLKSFSTCFLQKSLE